MTISLRVTSVSEAGLDRVNVHFVSIAAEPTALQHVAGTHNLTLNLSKTEAAGYFPGELYDITLNEVIA